MYNSLFLILSNVLNIMWTRGGKHENIDIGDILREMMETIKESANFLRCLFNRLSIIFD